MPAFDIVDSRTVRAEDGALFDVLEAIDALPWVPQLCPLMPHEYAVRFKSPNSAWSALEEMVRLSPDSYRALCVESTTVRKARYTRPDLSGMAGRLRLPDRLTCEPDPAASAFDASGFERLRQL